MYISHKIFSLIPQPMLFVAIKHSAAADWLKMSLKKKNPEISKLKWQKKVALIS